MASNRISGGRIVFALGMAIAIAVGPALAAFAGSPDGSGIVANPRGCTSSSTAGNNSFTCAPGTVTSFGAPSETDLTNSDTTVGLLYSPRH